MKAEWFARVDGQEYGPYTWQQMLQMAAEGRVPADLPVRRSIDKRWFAARQVPGLVAGAPPAAQRATTQARPKKDDSQLKRARPLASSSGSTPATRSSAVPVPPPPPPPRAAAAAAEPSPWPVIVGDTPSSRGKVKPPGAAPKAESGKHRLPERRSPLLIVGILSGLAAVVLMAGGIGVWAVWFRAPAAPFATQAAAELAPEAGDVEGKSAATVAAAATEGVAKDKEQGSSPTSGNLAAQEKLVKSIASWQSMAGVRSFGVSNASLQLTRVWRTDAASDGENQQSKRYVCVELTISNKSSAPLRYKGWNSYGEAGAILADESGKVLPLVPVDKTPEIMRQTRTSVPGGGTLKEVLVFDAPTSEEEVLHLVLPYSVFYSNVRPPHRALELTPDLMGVDLASAQPQAPAGPAPGNEQVVELDAVGAAAAGDKPPPKEPAPKAPVAKDAGKPPSLRDMINSDPSPPARPDKMPEKGSKEEKPKVEKGKDAPKKPENPFEPKGEDPLKGEEKE